MSPQIPKRRLASIDMSRSLLNFSELEKMGYQIEVFSSDHNRSNWRELNGRRRNKLFHFSTNFLAGKNKG
jgi:hypothetical protein